MWKWLVIVNLLRILLVDHSIDVKTEEPWSNHIILVAFLATVTLTSPADTVSRRHSWVQMAPPARSLVTTCSLQPGYSSHCTVSLTFGGISPTRRRHSLFIYVVSCLETTLFIGLNWTPQAQKGQSKCVYGYLGCTIKCYNVIKIA